MNRIIILCILFVGYMYLSIGQNDNNKIPSSYLKYYNSQAKIDTVPDSTKINPYNFHLYIVLRKKHYHALLTVKDTNEKILLTKDFDSLRIGRNFFNIPTLKKLPPIVLWELKSGDFNKKGKMAIH